MSETSQLLETSKATSNLIMVRIKACASRVNARGLLVGIALVGCISAVADGFAGLPAPVARRVVKERPFFQSTRMCIAEERSWKLTRRVVLVASLSAGIGVSDSEAHCLTQACLQALPDPLVDATSGVQGGGGASPVTITTKLPETAYARLKNGQVVCRIQLGCLQLSPKTSKLTTGSEAYWEATQENVVKAMKMAVDMGYTTFDLADVYGEAEDFVGAFHSTFGFPPGVMFNTKWIPTGTSPKNMTVVTAAVDKARTRMQTPTLDLLQMYWWDYDKPNYVEMVQHAQELASRRNPSLSGVAVTAFDKRHLQELQESGVDVVSAQMSCSIVDTRPLDGGMLNYCAQNQIAAVCHGSLLGGFLSDTWLGAAAPADPAELDNSQLRKYYKWLLKWGEWALLQELLRTLRTIADKHSSPATPISVANVAMRWVLGQRGVTSVITGARLGKASCAQHLVENARVFAFELDEQDLQAISGVQARATPLRESLGDVGDEFHKKNRKKSAGTKTS